MSIAAIEAHVSAGRAVTLRYSLTPANGVPTNIAERVQLTTTACAYGGKRTWFACPNCSQRIALLYLRGGRFACRKCHKVAYASQSCSPMQLTWHTQRKVEARLGQDGQRPKGMRWDTYFRLLDQIGDCERRRDIALATSMHRFMKDHARYFGVAP